MLKIMTFKIYLRYPHINANPYAINSHHKNNNITIPYERIYALIGTRFIIRLDRIRKKLHIIKLQGFRKV